MNGGLEILKKISQRIGGNILHGGEVSVSILSEETLKKYLDGSSVCRAVCAVSVYGEDQASVLEKISEAVAAAIHTEDIFAFKLCGAEGEYTDKGNYRYRLKFSFKYIEQG